MSHQDTKQARWEPGFTPTWSGAPVHVPGPRPHGHHSTGMDGDLSEEAGISNQGQWETGTG